MTRHPYLPFFQKSTRVFQNGNSQAIRIPKELQTEAKEYCISKIGEVYIAFPADDPWAPVRQTIGTFPPDFLADRNQPSYGDVSKREEL